MSAGTRKRTAAWTPTPGAKEASDYFNSLPFEQRKKLAPLLENYRQMGIAEALDVMATAKRKLDARIGVIRALDRDRP